MANETTFRPGFRISAIDVGVLVAGGIGSWFTAGIDASLGIAIAFVVAHFFLFCNVVRMGRSLELCWAGLFVLLAAATQLAGIPGWIATFTIMLVCTVVFVALQMRDPSYHCAFWERINPDLPTWWERHHE